MDLFNPYYNYSNCVLQCALPELDNALSKKVRSIIDGLLEKRPNSMKVRYPQQQCKKACALICQMTKTEQINKY